MEPVLLVNHVTERRQITKVKVDRWLSLVFFPKKKIGKKIKRSVLCLKHKYMKSLRNDVNSSFDNRHVRTNIHREIFTALLVKLKSSLRKF
jgi:hypothetical protein